ncbi:MAG: L-histidine N(alpha)-methyltransferase [Planctomycetes bacterium]|nr:L-histidine N(alpha)-methyltransferase [Planctomycetota bacterium]
MPTDTRTSQGPGPDGRTGAAASAGANRLDRIWQRAYAAKDRADLVALYRDWATSYDEDHLTVGFRGHETAAATLARYAPFATVTSVLDAGAGTGAAGEALRKLGYRNLTGIDLSPAMLEQARKKGVYRHLAEADLGLPLDSFPCSSFDAAILVGVFSYGQAPAHALDEIVRLVKPGGVVVFTLRVDFFEQDAMGVRTKMEELDRSQAWKLLEITGPAPYLPNKDPDALFRVWCYRVLETKSPPVDEEFAAVVRTAFMSESPIKRIDHSFIWNSMASRLYDLYTECPEYYLTDAELEILAGNAAEILDDDELVVELGCGSAKKISVLLEAAVARDDDRVPTYTPVDVSIGALEATKAEIDARFAGRIEVVPRCGRFDDVLASTPTDRAKLVLCFGGSIGNLETLPETVKFLETIRARMTADDRFVVGTDLHKDEAVLRAAYEAGARNRAFFLNMIRRINRELGANFDLDAFHQHSPYEADPPYEGIATRCVQLRLVTDRPQAAYVSSMHMEVQLAAGDAVQVGTSRKFRVEDIERLGELAGLRLRRQWFDARRYFALNEFVPA